MLTTAQARATRPTSRDDPALDRQRKVVRTQERRGYMTDEGDLELMLYHAAERGPNWVRLIREARDERNARLLEFLRAGRADATPQAGVSD